PTQVGCRQQQLRWQRRAGIELPNLGTGFAIQKTGRATALRFCVPTAVRLTQTRVLPRAPKRGPFETHAFPIADLISVVRVVRCDAGGCAASAHSAAQEEQIHAGAGAESRWRGGAQKA